MTGHAAAVQGQWSDDPTTNLVIADHSGKQVQVKIVATAGGRLLVSPCGPTSLLVLCHTGV